jgi:thioesterase domain-containing protein
VRGFRVELSEIESVLERHSGVAQACVCANGDVLVAYVAGDADAQQLGDHARRHLPPYMIPACFERVDALPLTASGKIDRRRLAERPIRVVARVEPQGETECRLAALWREVLGIGSVDASRSFAEHGGHSLSALAVSSRAVAVLGRPLPATWLIEGLNLRAIAMRLATETGPLISLAEGGPGAVLHLVPGVGGDAAVLRSLARRIARRRPVRAFDLCALPRTESASVETMATALVTALDGTTSPLLGGWSMGGVVAFAAAHQLEAAGRMPAGLILLDSVLAPDLPGRALDDGLPAWLSEIYGKVVTADGALGVLRSLNLPNDAELVAGLMAPWRVNRAAHTAYRPERPVCCPVAFLQARPGASVMAVDRWGALAAGPFRVFRLAADHFGLLDDPATANGLEDAIGWIESKRR